MKLGSLYCAMLAVACGCATVPEKTCAPAAAQPQIKVAVYTDDGAGGIGAVEWIRLVEESPEMELHLVDAKAVRAGALDGLDVFVMPGGSSKAEFTTLGTNGILRMKAFIRNGGGYIGTCAGCCLLMDGEDRRARMIPWNTAGSEKDTSFPTVQINEKGAAALGVKKGAHSMRYHGGPFMWPTTNVIEGARFEQWGTLDAEGTMTGKVDKKKRMHGSTVVVGGTYGKGRVFVTSCHPEYFSSTLYVVRGAFKYVTGRDVTFPARPRARRALTVGFFCSYFTGVEMAQAALDLAAEKDFDLVLVNLDGMRQRGLDHLDVLVLTTDRDKVVKTDDYKEQLREFIARGGKVVGYGNGNKVLPPEGVKCGTGQEVVRTIRRLCTDGR